MENGLVTYWNRQYSVAPKRCLKEIKERQSIKIHGNNVPSLKLGNLMGPFVILLLGYILSIFFWVAEWIVVSMKMVLGTFV